MARLSRLSIELDVAHDDGQATADELLDIATARAERALRDEGADPIGSTGHACPIGPSAEAHP